MLGSRIDEPGEFVGEAVKVIALSGCCLATDGHVVARAVGSTVFRFRLSDSPSVAGRCVALRRRFLISMRCLSRGVKFCWLPLSEKDIRLYFSLCCFSGDFARIEEEAAISW